MKIQATLPRREFLKHAAHTAAAAAAGWSVTDTTAAAEAPARSAGPMPVRTLGRTGLKLPILGYGGAALPRVWLNPLSHEDRVALVQHAFGRGLRWFDTAGNYFESQSILGEALQGVRDEVCLVTKVEATRPELVRPAVERSLRELRTDHLDVLLLHGTPGIQDMSVAQAMKIQAELIKLRDERVTRFIGLSAHGYFDKVLALLASGGFEVCMLALGYLPRGHDQMWSARMTTLRDACLARAHELGLGIVAMKVLGAGLLGAWAGHVVPGEDPSRLRQLPGAAIRHVLHDPRVHVLNLGMRLKEEVDRNLEVLTGDTTYTLEDRALLAGFSARLYETETVKKLRIE